MKNYNTPEVEKLLFAKEDILNASDDNTGEDKFPVQE